MEADRHRFAGSDLAGTAAARPENTAAGQKALREKLTAKAAALVPLLRAKAAEIEREGRIPDEVLAAIEAAQLFRHELCQIEMARQIYLRNGPNAHPFHSSIIFTKSLNR